MAKLLKIEHSYQCKHHQHHDGDCPSGHCRKNDMTCDWLVIPDDCPLQDAPEWVYTPRWPDGEHSFWVAVAMDEEQIVLEFEEFQQMYDTGFCGTVYAWAYRTKPEPPEIDRKDI